LSLLSCIYMDRFSSKTSTAATRLLHLPRLLGQNNNNSISLYCHEAQGAKVGRAAVASTGVFATALRHCKWVFRLILRVKNLWNVGVTFERRIKPISWWWVCRFLRCFLPCSRQTPDVSVIKPFNFVTGFPDKPAGLFVPKKPCLARKWDQAEKTCWGQALNDFTGASMTKKNVL